MLENTSSAAFLSLDPEKSFAAFVAQNPVIIDSVPFRLYKTCVIDMAAFHAL